MKIFKYILAPYKNQSSRIECPKCKELGTFAPYINGATNEIFHMEIGKCNRYNQCGYFYSIDRYFKDMNIPSDELFYEAGDDLLEISIASDTNYSIIENDIYLDSLSNYHINAFFLYLNMLFSKEIVDSVCKKYGIGSAKKYKGSTVFWYIDIEGNCRSGKILKYNTKTGKRDKDYFPNWAHTALKLDSFLLRLRFYGEHLLKESKDSIVVIVESEKTGILMSIYYPNYIWLATGSLEFLHVYKFSTLEYRTVYLFPDLNGFERWKKRAIEVKKAYPTIGLYISYQLEMTASIEQIKEGLDLYDFLEPNPKAFLEKFDLKNDLIEII